MFSSLARQSVPWVRNNAGTVAAAAGVTAASLFGAAAVLTDDHDQQQYYHRHFPTVEMNSGYCQCYASTSVTRQADRVERLLQAKRDAALSYDDLAKKIGVTNTYAAQLLLGQAKLTESTAVKLQKALPSITDQDIQDMISTMPMRTYDSEILKEPNVYRTYEAITHYGEAIKAIINEQCGDGIMSAIDFYLDVGTTTGVNGEKRVVITFNGKFLPFKEQSTKDNTASSPRD
jgi:cyanate lyase